MSRLKTKSLARYYLFVFIFIIVGVGGWYLASTNSNNPNINLVSTETSKIAVSDPRQVDLKGCYYQNVQCFKEPCEPIKVCPVQTDMTIDKPCQFRPACLDAKPACMVPIPPGGWCEDRELPTPTPTIYPRPKPSCVPNPCEGKVCPMIARDPGVEYCPAKSPLPTVQPTPTPSVVPTPVGTGKLTSFSVSGACGPTHFSTIYFSCNNNKMRRQLVEESCYEFVKALNLAKIECRGVQIQ